MSKIDVITDEKNKRKYMKLLKDVFLQRLKTKN